MDMRLIHLLILAFSMYLRNVSAETQNRVFVADTNLAGAGSIYSATTENLNFTQIPIDGIGNPFSLTFDPIEDKVYWSDATFRHIARASTDGSNFEIVVADVTSEGMAIDKLARTIVWGDPDLSRIVRTSLDGSIQEAAILENVRSPGGIVIDELASHIYWSSFAEPARIERANTDGTGRFILVGEDLGVPQGLTVDFQEKRIYWADVSRNSIETSDLLGNNRRVVLQEDPLIINLVPVGITVDREYVYMTSWQLRHVVRLDKYGLQPPELVGNVQLQQAGGLYSEQANVIDPTCEKDCQNEAQCRQLADGSECICQPGYLGENCEIQSNELISCTADPCLRGGRCVQERNYYTCVCRGGYYGVNCEQTPFVLSVNRGVGQIYSAPVTNLNNITSLPLPIAPPEIPTPEPGVPTNPTPEPIPSPELEPWAVSFDPSEIKLYWTNGWDGKIHRTDGIIDECIVSVGAIPYGLALNLEDRTLYWTQNSKVTMANMDGSSQRIVIQEGLQQPRDIEVDAAGQHIYWTDIGTGSIERANLDGSNRVVLVDNLEEPYGITIDYQGGVLYWGDALLNQIGMLDLTTGVRSVVVEITDDIHPFDLITYGNLVIWTDWNLPYLIQVEKSGANAGLASEGYYDQGSGIHLVEGNDNSCASEPCINQGRCRQLTLGFQCVCIEGFMGSICETATDDSCSSSPCLNGTCKQFPQGYSCECHQGYSGRLCETADIVFVVDQSTAVIYSASLVNIGDTFAALPLTILGQPAGVTVDNLEGILYWTNIIQGTISRSRLNGSGQEIFLDGLQQPSSLAFNPVTRAIFWISDNNTRIETSFLVGASPQTILENLDQIQDIALDSYQSHLYWTTLGLQPKIERATESGSERVNIIDTDLLIPTGLTIDAQQSRIYWSDAGKNTLEAASLDGTNRRILTDLSQLADINPFNVAIYRDFMYWTDRNLPNIGFLHRYLGIANAIGPQILQNAGGLAIYTSGFMLAECTDDQYACHDGLECIPYVWVCNGDPDCTDNSDELPLTCDYYRTTTEVPTDYPTTETEVPTDYPTTEVTTYTPGCRLDESTEYELYTITCSTGECIAIPCDGIFDCEDGSDESPELCDFVDVRLFGGKLPNTGRVEVYFNGQWGTVCDNSWNDEDAQVICRQLGFPEGNHKAVYRRELRLKRSETPIWLDNVSCLGNETNIADCYHNGWRNHNCNHREDAGVICLQDGCRLSAYDDYVSFSSYYQEWNYKNNNYDYFGPFMCDSGDCIAIPCNGEAECEDGSDEAPELCDSDVNVRLVGGTPTEGRLEVYFNGQWGTVCYDYGSNGYAQVVCRQLGFPEGNHQSFPIYRTEEYDLGTGQIWLSRLYCNGTESNIGSCSHRGWGFNRDCNHYDDVGVVCQGFCRQSTTITEELPLPPLSWRATSAGVTVESIQKCPLTTYHGGYGLANRTCLFDEEANNAFWDGPIPIDCGPEEALNLANFTKPITEGNVAEAAAWLSNVTKGLEGGGATPKDVSDIADIMTTVVDVESTDPEVTTSVTGICSNIVTATKDSGDQKEFDNHFLDILRAFEHQIRHSTGLRQQLDPVVESNLAVTLMQVSPQQASISGLSFAVRQNPDTGDNAFRPEDVMTSYEGTDGMRDARASMGETRTSITLPMSLFDTGNDETVGVGFTVHNSATLFPSNSDDGMIVSDIISANIEGVPSLNNLPEPVMIEFTAPGDNPVCVFWDLNLQGWSQEGCTLMARSADNSITCQCDHLTNFAVIAVPIDTIKPVISTMLTDFDNNTDSGQPYATVSWPAPTAIDNSGSVTLTSDYNSGDTFPIGTTDVTYTAVDPSGNSATFTFTILVIDVENPVISNVPATIFANTDRGKPSASVEWTSPTARDNSKSVTLTADYNSGDSFPIGDTEVTYTAIDQSGNNVTATFLVTVKDNEPPRVLSGCPVYIERFTDELSLDVAWTSPVFYDNSGMTVEQNSTATSPVVLALGRHVVDYNAWDPYGNLASCSISINVTAACLVSSASLRKGNFTWPVSRAENQKVDSNERCHVRTEERGNGLAFRVCIFNKTTGGSRWLEPKYEGCGEEDDFDLEELSETDVVEDNVDNVAEALNNITQELENPDTEDIEDIADTFTNIVNVEAVTPEVTMAVVGIISNIHDATDEREDEEVTDQDDDNMSDQMANNAPYFLEILMALEQQITRTTALGGLGGQPLKVVEPNIALATIPAPSRGSNTGLSFLVLQNNMKDREEDGFQSGDVKTLTNNEAVPEETRTSISLPASLFNNITGNDTVGVSFFVQNSDTLFPTNSSNQSVGGDVMSAIVVGIPDTNNLPEPVVLEFTAPGENPVCVSWDFNISDWSDEGCWFMNYTNTGRVICHCDHLTNFAVLVDVKYEAAHIILDIISKVGCGLSMVSLLATIVIFVVFRRLRVGPQATPRKILIQMCVALFCLYLVFLIGIDQVSNRTGCAFVATLLHFFTLASIMWMGVEAHNMYLSVVKVFDAQPEHFVLKASVFAWGVPLLISVISVGAGFHPYYDHLDYCFAKDLPLYYGIVLPVALVLLHNIITFSLVMYRLCKARLGGNVTKQSQTQKLVKRLQNAFAISILMGLTWVFGFFAIGDVGFAFSLIFCLCNSFQGFVVFILFCVRQDDVRRTLRPYFGFIGCQCADNQRSQTTSSSGLSPTSKSAPKSFYTSTTDFSATLPSPKPTATDVATDFSATTPSPTKDTAFVNGAYGMHDIEGQTADIAPPATKSAPEEIETNIDIESAEEPREKQTAGDDEVGDKLGEEEIATVENSEALKEPLLNAGVPANDNIPAALPADNDGFQTDTLPVISIDDEVSTSPKEGAADEADGTTADDDSAEEKPFWQEIDDSDDDVLCAPIEIQDNALGNAMIERSKSTKR